MEIIVGKTAGFCFGVRKAVEGSIKVITDNSEKRKVYCLGELVHNKQVMDELINQGVILIDDISNVQEKNSKVIVRAHGIKKEVYEYAQKHSLELVDFTCPFVLKIHDIVRKYHSDGYYIFVVGSSIHPETIGTISYCGDNSQIIENIDDIDRALSSFKKTNINKLLVVVQTTFSEEKFKKISEKIKMSVSKEVDLIIQNTICSSTSTRQKETEEIAKEVDLMIIIGGKNSSNTKKLWEVSKKKCNKTILIETEKEIDLELLKNYYKIGIMAGASTPMKSINDVIKKIKGDN